MTDSNTLDRQRRYLLDPWKFQPILLPPCHVRILIVTDSGGSFGDADFGLAALLGALASPPVPWVRFDVSTANRRLDATADLQNFRFDGHDLGQYDQIWMIGVERSFTPGLTDPELRAVAQFMDSGGGVFATGDHEDLGVSMCGRVPRVRSMRKWYWPNPGPDGEPVAPPTAGPDRHDTLSAGNDPGIQFDDQSDDVPQTITPRLYPGGPWNPWFHRAYPHPVLCGPRGVIRVLPDHPHEGECLVPADLTAAFTFDGYQTTEYPGGTAPEVIAWSVTRGRAVDANKGPLNPRTFGAVGAYDGHRAGVGRVVVDATWHHFFNINLVGALGSTDPVKSVGFDASPAGHAAYEDIKAYFRNIAVWLARPSSQRCLWWRALWWLRWHHRIFMDLRPRYLKSADALDLGELLRIGGEARDVLARAAGHCAVLRWVGVHLVQQLRPRPWQRLARYFDPWLPAETPRGPAEALYADATVDAALGAAVYAVAQAFLEPTEESRRRAGETDPADLTARHVDRGLRLMAEQLGEVAERLSGLGGALADRDGESS